MARFVRFGLAFLAGLSVAMGGARADEALPTAPALVTSPMPFIGITPCRIVDTRDATRPPGYGPPSLAAGVPRSFTLAGQCGIPTGAQAVSLNVTVVSPQGLGYVLLYPQGGSQPGVSTLNYVQGLTVANAAIVPLGTGGGVTVAAAVSGTDFLIDVNGYYGASPTSYLSAYLDAGNATTVEDDNTGVGVEALRSNTTGSSNTALGWEALMSNTTGSENTAAGRQALSANTTGSGNTALGVTLQANGTGSNNTGAGYFSLANVAAGSYNTAIGQGALEGLTSGNNNAAFPWAAGQDLATGSNNVYIGAISSPATESATIRIGEASGVSQTWIAGIYGATLLADALPVFVDPTGQFGTLVSSRRFKEDVRDLDAASNSVLSLRPVTFRYRAPAEGQLRYGLIAEEVEAVLPDLVVRGADGAPVSVRYDELPVLLLQEIQKQQAQIEAQKAESSALEARTERAAARERNDRRRIEALRARLSALEEGGGR
ncbi:MAG TPA: tail fiber domain-containing protein [Thermoanaerobaculia bacterium]|nr:tail fiber domain-containing protein [Thermoanaerobaculia bacterium]